MKEVNILKYEPYRGTVLFIEKTYDGVIFGLEFLNSRQPKVYYPQYELTPFFCGLSTITIENDAVNFLNTKGIKLWEKDVDLVRDFIEDRSFIKDNDEVILIDTEGNRIKSFTEDYMPYHFNDGLAQIMKMEDSGVDITSGYIDYQGNFVIPPIIEKKLEHEFDILSSDDFYWDGLIRFQQNDKYGFIDKDINIIIPTIYEDASRFENGLSAVKLNGKYGYINKQNEFVIKPQYDDATAFWGDYAVVNHEEQILVIDKSERIILSPKCNYILSIVGNKIAINKNGKFGIIDFNENEIIPPIFDRLDSFNQGLAYFIIEDCYGFIETNKNFLLISR